MTCLTEMVAEQPRKYRLDPVRIINTAEKQAINVEEKLPHISLAGLARNLTRVARETDEPVQQAARPIYAIRLLSFLAVIAGIAAHRALRRILARCVGPDVDGLQFARNAQKTGTGERRTST